MASVRRVGVGGCDMLASYGSVAGQGGIKYYYEVYNVLQTSNDYMVSIASQNSPFYASRLSANQIRVTTNGDSVTATLTNASIALYAMDSVVSVVGWEFEDEPYQGKYYSAVTARITGKKKDTFREVITASPNAFPLNGIHTDGFWYVRMGLVT